MRDRKRRSKTENGIFQSEEKYYFMRSDFDDFRAAFFDLAFSIATAYRNGGDFRSDVIWKCKYNVHVYYYNLTILAFVTTE